MVNQLFFRRHFQVAYVANDARAAMRRLADDFGVRNWQVAADRPAESLQEVIGLAWVGELMLEVIQPRPSRPSLYTDWVPPGSDEVRLHHLAFIADGPADYAQAVAGLEAMGYPSVYSGSFGARLDFAYIDTRAAVGHYYEIFDLKPEGRAFFDAVPRN